MSDLSSKEVKIEAPIVDVTVFQGRALVTREGSVEVPQGERTVVLKNLPEAVDPDSMRVSGEGLEGSKITGVEVHREFLTEALDSERRELEAKLKEVEDKEREIHEELGELERELSMLEAANSSFQADFPRALAYQKASVEDHSKFMDYIRERRKGINGAIRQMKRDLEKAQKEADVVRNQMSMNASKGSLEKRQVEIGVVAKNAGPMKLTVSYAIPGANWEPLYDVRVMADDKKVDLSYYGIVRQNTGEDWDNVNLTLSTAPYMEAKELPELTTWYLSTYKPAPRKSGLRRMERKKRALAPSSAPAREEAGSAGGMAFAAQEAEILDEMDMETAEVEESGEAIVFKVQRRDSVPSDGEPKKLAIAILDMDCKTEYLTVPKLTPEAYLKARVKNETEFVFLSGKVNLFQEDDFIGSTLLDTIAPREKFNLSLGVARQIKVKRELKKKETDSAGLLRGGRRITYGYRIKIENHKKSKAKLVVFDQLPMADHEDIKVESLLLEPKPKKVDDLKKITWKFYLDPEEKKNLKMEFSVEHPKGLTVFGLPE